MMNTQDKILDATREWLGTPYHHQGDVMGFGVDCAMILVRVFCDLQIIPMIDPRPYSTDWHLHRNAEVYLGWIKQYADEVTEPQPGDVALFRFGRCLSHGGIVETVGQEVVMIHASRDAGCVERIEVRRFGHRFAGYWRVRQ